MKHVLQTLKNVQNLRVPLAAHSFFLTRLPLFKVDSQIARIRLYAKFIERRKQKKGKQKTKDNETQHVNKHKQRTTKENEQ